MEADLSRAQDLRDRARAALRHLRDELTAGVPKCLRGLPDDLSLAQLNSWLQSRAKALEAWSFVRNVERDLREAEADARAARAKLVAAFVVAGIAYDVDTSFETLLTIAQAAIEHESELKALRNAIEDRQRNLEYRERDSEKVAVEDRAWTSSWTKACATCWLGETGSAPPLAEVREIPHGDRRSRSDG